MNDADAAPRNAAETGPDETFVPKVEIGWILSGPWQPEHRRIALETAERMRGRLAALLPDFVWRTEVVERGETGPAGPAEPVLLLDDAEVERERRAWDFVLVLTESDLVSYTRPSALAAPARIFFTAIASTARLAEGGGAEDEPRFGRRLLALALHLFGRLNGLSPRAGDGFMREFEGPAELDAMDGYGDQEIARLRRNLARAADPRVEEMRGGRRNVLRFYLRSIWENRQALPAALMRMRPWLFPTRLTRLMTAAGSALAILLMTAESWEVAANLSTAAVALVSGLAILLTSFYLLKAQRLLARPGGRGLSEQRALSNVSTVVAVVLGMAVTYLAIFAAARLCGSLLFGDALLGKWVGEARLDALPLRSQLAGLAATLSLAIGALGASFEPHGYFRHVTHIDDEL